MLFFGNVSSIFNPELVAGHVVCNAVLQFKRAYRNKGKLVSLWRAAARCFNVFQHICLDDFSYYQQHLYGEVVLGKDSAQFSFLTEYQWQSLNDLILNLRKDGLVLRNITIGQEHYDVVEALEKKSSELVDKEVILLINRYPQETIRSLFWVKPDEFSSPSPSLNVELHSDGEIIDVKVTRF